MKTKAIPLEVTVLGYLILYLPYFVLVRWLATTPAPELGRPLSGLEILPATQVLSGVATLIFVWAAGWIRSAHQVKLGGISLPAPTRWTALSGLCTALVLVTVPLSVTFTGVSIPFIQLLMRGDVLVLAPLVDIVAGRKVRWYSWIALLLCSDWSGRDGVGPGRFPHLPPLAITTIVLYSVGYLGYFWRS